jgi:hypothetical protein
MAIACCSFGASALAADTHFRPKVEVRAESNTNRGLDVEEESDVTGVIGILEGDLLIRTPRSDTHAQPRLRLQEYSGDNNVKPLEAFLDFSSEFRGERSLFHLAGRYSYQDLSNAELSDPEFDDTDPDDPTSPDTGRVDYDTSRQRAQIRPEYLYNLTQNVGLGASAIYEAVVYEDQINDRVDYDYALAEGLVRWESSPRVSMEFGAYASKFETDDESETDAVGVRASLERRWSESTRAILDLRYEDNEISEVTPEPYEESVTGFGAEVTILRTGEVSTLRASLGRTFSPDGRGVKKEADQVRFEYDRDLRPRLKLDTAVRYITERALGERADEFGDRDYAAADVGLRWLWTPTWYVSGGYRYRWQDREVDPSDADNHILFLGVGFQGLAPPPGRVRR